MLWWCCVNRRYAGLFPTQRGKKRESCWCVWARLNTNQPYMVHARHPMIFSCWSSWKNATDKMFYKTLGKPVGFLKFSQKSCICFLFDRVIWKIMLIWVSRFSQLLLTHFTLGDTKGICCTCDSLPVTDYKLCHLNKFFIYTHNFLLIFEMFFVHFTLR